MHVMLSNPEHPGHPQHPENKVNIVSLRRGYRHRHRHPQVFSPFREDGRRLPLLLLCIHLYDGMVFRVSHTNFLLSAEYRASDSDLLRGINGARFDSSVQLTCNNVDNDFQNCLMLSPDEYTNFYSDLLCYLCVRGSQKH